MGDVSMAIVVGIVAAIVIVALGLFFFLANGARTQVRDENSPKRRIGKNGEDHRATGIN
jgi:nitrogen fixation-related uncharacterized protein